MGMKQTAAIIEHMMAIVAIAVVVATLIVSGVILAWMLS